MFSISHKKEPFFLVIGDVFFLFFSLWLTLLVRYNELPQRDIFFTHLVPFSILFVVWLVVFFIAGLYEKHTVMLQTRLPAIVFNALLANSIIAVLFFYFIPYFDITPKTNLFIYLLIFFLLTLGWRIYGRNLFAAKHRQKALLAGTGREMQELFNEINTNNRYDLVFTSSIDLEKIDKAILERTLRDEVTQKKVELIVIDLHNEKIHELLPTLYRLIFDNVQFISLHEFYEEIFDRIPITTLTYNWFIENISTSPKVIYDLLKRLMDIVVALIFGTISLVFYPFVYIGTKIQDGGPLFIRQERVGANNKIIYILKFRSMTTDDKGNYGKVTNKVTPFGQFLRKSRIDEFPQFWNIVRGDLSFVGPRPELPALVSEYEKQLPYYNIRHLIKPGLSGWAQIYHEQHPHHGIDTEETRNKLSYDLYYIKNRSIMLDIKVLLRTFRTFLSRAGR